MHATATLVEYRYALGVDNDNSSTHSSASSRPSGIANMFDRFRNGTSPIPTYSQGYYAEDQAEMLDDDNLAWGSSEDKASSGLGLRKKIFGSKSSK